ncbi:MgtC/SapB family protein [Paenibacillus whitsoniae]|uniref:MgtC/SapB family protein n=1 Tax=Paenibacillus whitsoniae TaxID=2496558 RepID=A0A430JHX0_9BACL|nr:MgtC/SapB family protein [Paenibacillus whitsoniae]RTE10648.1 MgtC/SapB family protein [Paenibacillus whitsoniae]
MTASASVWTISHGELFLRLVLAVLMGGAVGIEREWHNHAAGFRTHILVCLGSTTIMLLSIYGFSQFVNETNVRIDPARIAAQVVSGIGFIGAGAILRNGSVISGLTTAASIWVVAAIGLCIGAGFEYAAYCCTALLLVSLLVLNKWEKYVMRNRRNQELTIQARNTPSALGQIVTTLVEEGLQIVKVKTVHDSANTKRDAEDASFLHMHFVLAVPHPTKLMMALERIRALEFVLGIESQVRSLDIGDRAIHPVQEARGKA